MLGTSPEYDQIVRGPHNHVAELAVYREGALIRTLDIHEGGVDADQSSAFLRRFDAKVSDPTGELTPGDMRDLLAPFGTEVVPSRGVEIPIITEYADIDDTQAQWAEGEHINTVAHASGDLVLGAT
jgi:hypothetical protein